MIALARSSLAASRLRNEASRVSLRPALKEQEVRSATTSPSSMSELSGVGGRGDTGRSALAAAIELATRKPVSGTDAGGAASGGAMAPSATANGCGADTGGRGSSFSSTLLMGAKMRPRVARTNTPSVANTERTAPMQSLSAEPRRPSTISESICWFSRESHEPISAMMFAACLFTYDGLVTPAEHQLRAAESMGDIARGKFCFFAKVVY